MAMMEDEMMGLAQQYGIPVEGDPREIMNDEDIQDVLQSAASAAKDYMESVLEPDMSAATDRYKGLPFGNEQDGRSSYVARTTYETVHSQLASLCRVFYGPNDVVEFLPRHSSQRRWAKLATKAVNRIVDVDNDGFTLTHGWMKDALIRRIGVVKYSFQEYDRVRGMKHTNITAQEMAVLQQMYPDAQVTITAQYEPAPVEVMFGEPDEPRFDAEIVLPEGRGKICIDHIPPEEFLYLPQTRDLDSAPIAIHQRESTPDELIAMGIDPVAIENEQGQIEEGISESMKYSRMPHARKGSYDVYDTGIELDPSQRPVLFSEVYMLVDADGDGRSELRMFQCLGSKYEIVGDPRGELMDELPFAVLTPYPEPHTLVGGSTYDAVKDIERVESDLYRGILNSLSKSIDPDTEAVASQVNMSDLLSPEVSKIIRVRKPGMIREVSTRFSGADAIPVVELMQSQREARTGQSRSSSGLEADSLQSTTALAAAETVSASHLQADMLARTFAETGFKRLYRGVLKLMVRHGVTREVRDGGEYVQVNPAAWDADFDLAVNVGIGYGKNEEKIAALQQMIQYQAQAMEAGLPFVGNVELRNTAAELATLLGLDAELFFQPWGPEQEQQMQEAMSKQPPPPDPNMELIKVEQLKVQTGHLEKMRELDLKDKEITMESRIDRSKLRQDAELGREELEIKRISANKRSSQ